MGKVLRWPAANPHLLPIDMNDPALALYLPMWYPHGDMTGDPIYSYDLNRHECDVTGATYGLQGRTFDGVDDFITIPDTASLDIATKITIILWTQPLGDYGAGTNAGIIAKSDSTGPWWMGVTRATSVAVCKARQSDNTEIDLTPTKVLSLDTSYQLALVADGTNIKFYVNAVEEDSESYDGTLLTNNVDIVLGKQTTAFYEGLIGEVLIYSRDFTLPELVNNYEVTKWRYQ